MLDHIYVYLVAFAHDHFFYTDYWRRYSPSSSSVVSQYLTILQSRRNTPCLPPFVLYMNMNVFRIAQAHNTEWEEDLLKTSNFCRERMRNRGANTLLLFVFTVRNLYEHTCLYVCKYIKRFFLFFEFIYFLGKLRVVLANYTTYMSRTKLIKLMRSRIRIHPTPYFLICKGLNSKKKKTLKIKKEKK